MSILSTCWITKTVAALALLGFALPASAEYFTYQGELHFQPAAESAKIDDARDAQRGLTRADAAPAAGNFKVNPNAPYAHPFYWAPFILMGNWL